MVNRPEEELVAPHNGDETTEYDNRIEDPIEIDPEDEESETEEASAVMEQIDQQFARYERNYRARRIRELTLGPTARRRGRSAGRRKSASVG